MKRAPIIALAVCFGLTACGFDGSIDELPAKTDTGSSVSGREKSEFEVCSEEYGFRFSLPEEFYADLETSPDEDLTGECDLYPDSGGRLIMYSSAGDAGDFGAMVMPCGSANAFTFLGFGIEADSPSKGVEVRRDEVGAGRRGYVLHNSSLSDYDLISGSYELDSGSFLNLTYRINKNVRKSLQEQRVREAWDSLLTFCFDDSLTVTADFGAQGRLEEVVPTAGFYLTSNDTDELYAPDNSAALTFRAVYAPSVSLETACAQASDRSGGYDEREQGDLISRCGVKGRYFLGKNDSGSQTAEAVYPTEDGGTLTLSYTYTGDARSADADLPMRMKTSLRSYER